MGEERGRTFWLVVGDHDGRREVFALGVRGETKTIPVFSFEEEAQLFLRFGRLKGRWRARGIAATDLISTLTGPCRGAQNVVLDPFPEIGLRGYLGAVSLRREEFVDLLTLEHGTRARPSRGLGRVHSCPPTNGGVSPDSASPREAPNAYPSS